MIDYDRKIARKRAQAPREFAGTVAALGFAIAIAFSGLNTYGVAE